MTATRRIPVYSIYQANGHPPLALGMVISAAKQHNGGTIQQSFDFIRTPINSVDSGKDLIRGHGPGILLVSDYIWTNRKNLELAEELKSSYPELVEIHGGPNVPKYEYALHDYFSARPTVDIAVHGEGEVTCAMLLEHLASQKNPLDIKRHFLTDVAGITYRSIDDVVHTLDRERIADLDSLPSPYIDGWFSRDQLETWVAAIVETNRGCPYGCTFCDWGSATLTRIRKFGLDRVKAEIEWVARNQIGILWVADANFGIFERDVEIAEWIGCCRQRFGYPRQIVVNYAKNATMRLAEIIRVFTASKIRADALISIQTHDAQTLINIARSNIKSERYEELIDIFRAENLPISTDLIFGLPGSDMKTLIRDLQFFFDRKIYAKIHPAQVLVNSPMAHRDYMRKFSIQTDANGFITSTYSCTSEEIAAMWILRDWYMILYGFCILKYVLFYVQLDCRIPAMTFVCDLQHAVSDRGNIYPALSQLLSDWRSLNYEQPFERKLRERSAHQWAILYAEVGQFIREHYGTEDAGLDTILLVQARLMPSTDRSLPETLIIAHDVVQYFVAVSSLDDLNDLQWPSWRCLSKYSPGTVTVRDPYGLCDPTTGDVKAYDIRGIDWELSSELSNSNVERHYIPISESIA